MKTLPIQTLRPLPPAAVAAPPGPPPDRRWQLARLFTAPHRLGSWRYGGCLGRPRIDGRPG